MEYVYVVNLNMTLERPGKPRIYKIGRTANPKQRMRAYRRYGKEPLCLIPTNDSTRLEKDLHERYKHCRQRPGRRPEGWGFGRREMYALSDDELAEIMALKEVMY